MAHAKVVHPENVMPFIAPGCEDMYISRMLIDLFNCGSEKLQVNHGIVKAGKALPGAVHNGHDELYVILEGRAALDLDGELFELKPGTVVFIPGGTFHAICNENSASDLELITVWPGQPAKGANEMYDMRLESWGTSYRESDEEINSTLLKELE
jgi:mannose-6-phosphate isomerase-like protein (cupin superfamily)